jgi:type IV pilus assembly protein PilO
MRRSFSIPRPSFKNTTSVLRSALGALLLANLIAGWFVVRPLGGSADELSGEAASLRTQLAQRRVALDRTRVHVMKVENGHTADDEFMQRYFLARRTAASTILAQLAADAHESHIKVKVHSFNEEPIEGSDDLNMMVISGEYEGNYSDLLQYVNRIDRSPRLLIIESLSATPQQGAPGVLNISIKFDTFVREDDGLPVVSKEAEVSDSAPAPSASPAQPAAAPQQQLPAPVRPVLSTPVSAQQQPAQEPQQQPQPASAAPAQVPALAGPPPRPRGPTRMQMRRPATPTDEDDTQNPSPQPPEDKDQ